MSRMHLLVAVAVIAVMETIAAVAPTSALCEESQAITRPTKQYAPLPELVTSFGAAIENASLYVYGGHTGRAHAYHAETQANTLRRLDLATGKWETLLQGPRLQGLAMVAHNGKLYRIGGFTAKNKDGEEQDLWSQDTVACYSIGNATDKADKADKARWTELPRLPQPRSSFDAAVLDGKIYVVGGWTMAGKAEHVWLQSAYSLDLSSNSGQDAKWVALPQPPFQRRALSVAAHDGKLYVIGGMPQKGEPTRRVDIYDPQSQRWSQGPDLQGKVMDGFGSAAFATGGRLYVSTYSGKLQRLSANGKSWEVVQTLERDRFFHRMLPISEKQLLTVGGASMETGKFEEVDVIDVSKLGSKK